MPDPKFLTPSVRDAIANAPVITKEELESLRKIETEEYFEASSVLGIKDVSGIPELRDFHFGWLNLEHRRRVGMGHWRWVNGELAALVRKHSVVQEAVGGGKAVDVISNGDMILGFMPMKVFNRRKEYLASKNREQLEGVRTQQMGQGALDEHHTSVADVKIRRVVGGQAVED